MRPDDGLQKVERPRRALSDHDRQRRGRPRPALRPPSTARIAGRIGELAEQVLKYLVGPVQHAGAGAVAEGADFAGDVLLVARQVFEQPDRLLGDRCEQLPASAPKRPAR